MNYLYSPFHWNASKRFKMKNPTEMIVSLLLKILINDHSLNSSKKAINRLLLPTAPTVPSRSTDRTKEFGIIRVARKGGSSLKTCLYECRLWQIEHSLQEDTVFCYLSIKLNICKVLENRLMLHEQQASYNASSQEYIYSQLKYQQTVTVSCLNIFH